MVVKGVVYSGCKRPPLSQMCFSRYNIARLYTTWYRVYWFLQKATIAGVRSIVSSYS